MTGVELKWMLKRIGIPYKTYGAMVGRSVSTIQRKISWDLIIPVAWETPLITGLGSKARWEELRAEYRDSKGGR